MGAEAVFRPFHPLPFQEQSFHIHSQPFAKRRNLMSAIVDIVGREILDSRGNPTVECDVYSDRKSVV